MIDLTYCPKATPVILRSGDGKQEIKTDSETVFNYIRGQITRWRYEGWTLEYMGKRYPINTMGEVEGLLNGVMGQNEILLSYIDANKQRNIQEESEAHEDEESYGEVVDSIIGCDVFFEDVQPVKKRKR